MSIFAEAPPNEIGLIAHQFWCDDFGGRPLLATLEKSGIVHRVRDLPRIAGMAGNASLVGFVSPRFGREVTVLLVPLRGDVDTWGEDHFFFALDFDAAVALGEAAWADRYDECRRLVDPRPATAIT